MTLARVAFIGCGSHATHNIFPTLRYANCALEAVCDLNRTAAERNARHFGAPAVYTDYEKMLDEIKPDGVLVVGPPFLHYEAAKAALARAIPVFTEKPPAPDLKSVKELVALARQHGTFLMPGYMKRHGLTYRKARELMQSGAFEPASAFIRYGHWASDHLPSMLHTMSCHAIDLALALFGRPVSLHFHVHRRSEDRALTIALTLVFESGVPVQLMLDSSQPRIQERLEISGRMKGGNALLIVDNVQNMELHRQGRNGVDLAGPSGYLEPPDIQPDFDLEDIQIWRPDFSIPNMGQSRLFFQGYVGQVREFITAIQEKREPWPGTDDALGAMRVIDAMLAHPDGGTLSL